MNRMTSRVSLRVAVLVTLATCAAAGCGDDGASVDKAGGTGEPVTLRMASAYGDLGDLPAVAYFVEQVDKVSDGAIKIEVVDEWGDLAQDAEAEVVRGVAQGDVDLGWAGSRVFDTLGVTDFQALTAPMLVDSYALQDALIQSGVTEEMMTGLDEVGVEGLGVLAEGLRKPVGVERPIVGLQDWRGITFGTVASNTQAAAIRALGATPAEVLGPGREEAIEDGRIQGFEYGLYDYARDPGLQNKAPYVTANVNLWPLMSVVFANPERLSSLNAEQRGWLEEAARDAADRSPSLVDEDSESVMNSCEGGARFATASAPDLAALEEAFAPAYASLGKDSTTQAFIDQIRTLKKSVVPAVALSIAADCTGEAPPPDGSVHPDGSESAAARLNGTYRFEISSEDAQEADMVDPEDTYPIVTTIVLEDGRLEGGCFGSQGGTYSVEGDRIAFYSAEYDYASEVTFEQDDDGNLLLTPLPGMDAGDAFQCFSEVWTKIE